MSRERRLGALVDLSNVCCDSSLGGSGSLPRWSCFERILQAWSTSEFLDNGDLLALADANLRYRLGDGDRLKMKAAVRSGMVEEVASPADTQILARARAGLLVVSMDNFVDYRHLHPWIQGNRSSFVGWRVEADRVLLSTRDMGTRRSFSISAAEQNGDLKARHLVPGREGLLEYEYRCGNSSCLQHQISPSRLIVLPAADDDGTAMCPSCGTPLVRLDRRAASVELKLSVQHGDAKLRVAVSEGEPLVLGRAVVGAVDIAHLLEPSSVNQLSRRHAEIRVDPDAVWVRDLGSTNGSLVRVWDQKEQRFGGWMELQPGEGIHFRDRDQILLARSILVERSGQRLPTAQPGTPLAQPWADPTPSVAMSQDSGTEKQPGGEAP